MHLQAQRSHYFHRENKSINEVTFRLGTTHEQKVPGRTYEVYFPIEKSGVVKALFKK
jgi:hypothetical protein